MCPLVIHFFTFHHSPFTAAASSLSSEHAVACDSNVAYYTLACFLHPDAAQAASSMQHQKHRDAARTAWPRNFCYSKTQFGTTIANGRKMLYLCSVVQNERLLRRQTRDTKTGLTTKKLKPRLPRRCTPESLKKKETNMLNHFFLKKNKERKSL